VLAVHYSDASILAEELSSFGPEVTVLEPASLRELVVQRLRRLVADHDDDGARPVASSTETGARS
jgi:proteasome accessory factor B